MCDGSISIPTFCTTEAHYDVAPILNRLIIFPSDTEHEVLHSRAASRYAITFWFSGDAEVPENVARPVPAVILPALDDAPLRVIDKNSIHVSVVAYNDMDVANTINDLFAKVQYAYFFWLSDIY